MATIVGHHPQHHHHHQFVDKKAEDSKQDHAHHGQTHHIHHSQSRNGHWLPRDRKVITSWVTKQAEAARAAKQTHDDEQLDPSLLVFKKLVHENNTLVQLANDMFTEASTHYPTDPVGHCALQDFDEFLFATNLIIKAGPQWYDPPEPQTAIGLIGFPINALLDWPMGTVSGYQFWMDPGVNLAMGNVLKTWGCFLKSPESRATLDEKTGWLSQTVQEQLATKANDGVTDYTFQQLFKCDPSAPYLGFGSWDDFFTREFCEGIRPVEAPDSDTNNPKFPDPSLVITNACESAPLQVKTGVKMVDTFFLKGQPYSLINMLNANTAMVEHFVGGTVYQAFLSAMSYHRWHAPVSGTVKGIELVPGTYYSENWFEGLAGAQNPTEPDPAAPNYSQPYISAVATRGIIYIEANNPKIGLMAIVFIGMAEVSSCEFVVEVGQSVEKGQQIGMFHFGGSSHCMLFREGVNLGFVHPPPPGGWDMDTENNFAVNSALAVVL